ncbi:MAG: leucine-rich repeat domain-containing protein [Prevotella sp.]|nr:leucine-rich repeat domain-containing protein [Prevotella sp.]
MNRIILSLCVLTTCICANAQTFTYKGLKYSVQGLSYEKAVINKKRNNRATLESYNLTKEKVIVLPDTVTNGTERYYVRDIASHAFENNTTIESIQLPAKTRTIGAMAFSRCTALKSITIPASIRIISPWAFGNCTNLNKVTLTNRVKVIDSNAFANCPSLTTFDIPGSVNRISGYAFANCINLKNVKLNKGINIIGTKAFADCKSLNEITIPNTVYEFGDAVFAGSGIKALRILRKHPAKVSAKTFDGIDTSTVTLYVPRNQISRYRKDEIWNKFKNIKELN